MTDLSASPAAVAVVKTAGTLPIFLLAIPRRRPDRHSRSPQVPERLAQTGILVGALIGLPFLGGVAATLMGPTWQAIVPELEKREEAKSAVALKSLGISIARSIGPAAGGLLLAAFGAGVTCGADIATYPAVIAALIWWPRASSSNTMSKSTIAWLSECGRSAFAPKTTRWCLWIGRGRGQRRSATIVEWFMFESEPNTCVNTDGFQMPMPICRASF